MVNVVKFFNKRRLKRKFYELIAGKKIDYYNCNFNEIISLGYNCEISQRLSDIFKKGKFEHYLYTWSYEYDRNLFLESLNHLNNFANSDYAVLPSGMIKHKKYNIGFHSRYEKELINENNLLSDKVFEAVEELKSRLNHLALKFEDVFGSDKSVLFVIKLAYKDFNEDLNFISDLNKIIKNKFTNPKAKYKLLVVISRKDYPLELRSRLVNQKIENVDFGIIEAFSPAAFTDIKGDIFGWYKLLKSYIKSK